jgi:hypothetical protein
MYDSGSARELSVNSLIQVLPDSKKCCPQIHFLAAFLDNANRTTKAADANDFVTTTEGSVPVVVD